MKISMILRLMVFVCLMVFLASGKGVAAETATKEECVAKSKEAAELVNSAGLDAAIEKINDPNGPFVWKDTYVFALDMDSGKVIAHPIKPKLIGKMLTGLKDVNGKMFFVEFINVGKSKGEGWVDYMWPKPGENYHAFPPGNYRYVYDFRGQCLS
ncbi:MAG: sodium:calcium antiporter [Desulfobacteraceae bacterium]|nr:MAG: sodium:calcium antiporter [Desulfobacteraceae bacterium]